MRSEIKEKLKQYPLLAASAVMVTLTDAITTTLAHFKFQTTELNPFIAPLMPHLTPTSMIILLSLMPLPFIALILYLWARVDLHYMFRNTMIAITMAKGIASINNHLLYQGYALNEIVLISYIPVIVLPTAGMIQDITSTK